MTIEEMKKIAAARTKGKWIFEESLTDPDWVDMECPEVGHCSLKKDDAKFIAMAADNWDKLMAVVEAAQRNRTAWAMNRHLIYEKMKDIGIDILPVDPDYKWINNLSLGEAIAALERE